jgi:lipopolysaccharide/colanic/teichoic acid biosynthesis glycosyltransferase
MKRFVDIVFSFVGLLLSGFVILLVMLIIWLGDFHSPLYISKRVGKDGHLFDMVKLRSMIVNADKTGVDSTSTQDPRITEVGRFIRKYKLDELVQLWNVFTGSMSLVGPRPNVKREIDLYTNEEKKLLTVKPGITDFASIIFADENDILKDSKDPDLDYNQLIRPWKSRLGLIYINNQSFLLDMKLLSLTALAIFSRQSALLGVYNILSKLNIDPKIRVVSLRQSALEPYPPPGASEIVTSRGIN